MTDEPHRTRTFTARLDLDAPRQTVWRALADPAELARWFAPEARVDARVGGTLAWDWGDGHAWVHRIEHLEPGARLRTRYDSAVDDGAGGKKPLYVEFVLEGDGGTTVLTLVQSGFGDESGFDAEYDGISRGWPVELGSLRLYVERHAGRARRLTWARRSVGLRADEAWRRLTGNSGFACGTGAQSLEPGQPFRFVSDDGDVFEGTTIRCNPHEFSGCASSHGDGFLRLSTQEWCGSCQVWCWLATWGGNADVDALEELHGRWEAMLDRLFGDADR